MLDNPWAYGVDPTKQLCFQPVFDCINWPVLGSFNKWKIIQFTNKTTSIEDFDEVHKVVLDGISGNRSFLLTLVKYGAINADYPKIMVIM